MAEKNLPKVGRRGPLPKPGNLQSREKYKCIVTECRRDFRSDSLRLHYSNQVDFVLLSEIKNLDRKSGLCKIEKLNPTKKNHTLHFYENKIFSLDQIPSFKKRPASLSPFERCKVFKGIISILIMRIIFY